MNKCQLIKDLYPVYSEKLCHPDTLNEIETHLDTCVECQNYYNSENKLEELLGEVPLVKPSSKVDQKLVRKVKWIRFNLLFTVVILFLIGNIYTNYVNNRMLLQRTMSLYYSSINRISLESTEHYNHVIVDLQNQLLYETLSKKEKKIVDQSPYGITRVDYLQNFVEYYQEKQRSNELTTMDHQVYFRLTNLIDQWENLVREDTNQMNQYFNHQWNPFVTLIHKKDPQFKKYVELVKEINELSYIYSHFQVLPEQMNIPTRDEAKESVLQLLGITNSMKYKEISNGTSLDSLLGYMFDFRGDTWNKHVTLSPIDLYPTTVWESELVTGDKKELSDEELYTFIHSKLDILIPNKNYVLNEVNSISDVDERVFEIYVVNELGIRSINRLAGFQLKKDASSWNYYINIDFLTTVFTKPIETKDINYTKDEVVKNNPELNKYKFLEERIYLPNYTNRFELVYIYRDPKTGINHMYSAFTGEVIKTIG